MPTKKQLAEAESLARSVDWAKIDALSDADIAKAAAGDKDAVLPADAELGEFDLVLPARSRTKPPHAAE